MPLFKTVAFIISTLFLSNFAYTYDQQRSPKFMNDQFGRSLILHGVNISESAKHAPGRIPWHEERDIARLSEHWGFNTVRFTLFWDALMPLEGVINYAYIEAIYERLEWFGRHGLYAVFDMHQNLWSKSVSPLCGEYFSGAPEWATYTDGAADTSCEGGFGILNSPATTAAYDNFWDYASHPELQDNFILAWTAVAERLRGHKALLAYNAFNEPRPGNLNRSVFGEFNTSTLPAFYQRWVSAMRKIDSEVYLQLEPASIPANFGFQASLPKINDTRAGESKIVYSPHVYPLLSTENLSDNITYDSPFISAWNQARVRELNADPRPLYVGEFGARYVGTSVSSKDLALIQMDMLDTMLASWAIWNYDQDGIKFAEPDPHTARRAWAFVEKDGSETPLLNYIVRPYAQATAGTPEAMQFKLSTKTFTFRYEHNTNIDAATEIYVPFKRLYDDSWKINIQANKAIHYRYTIDTHASKIFLDIESMERAKVKVSIEDIDTDIRHFRHFYFTDANSEAHAELTANCLTLQADFDSVVGTIFEEKHQGIDVALAQCNADDKRQLWFYEHKSGRVHNAFGLCLDIDNGNIEANARVQAKPCIKERTQQFTYLDKYFQVRANDNLAIGLGDRSTLSLYLISARDKKQTNSDVRWTASQVKVTEADWSNMRNEAHNKCLEVENTDSVDTARLQLSRCDASKDEQMYYHDIVTGAIRSKTGACLDTSENGSNNGAAILVKACNDSAAQAFDNDNGTHYALRARPAKRIYSPRNRQAYKITTNSHSRSARDNFRRSQHNYAKLVQNDELFYQLRSGKNGKCLAVAGSPDTVPTPGTRLQVQDCWFIKNNPKQLFYYSPTTQHLLTKGGLCVDWGGNLINGGIVRAEKCQATRDQRFYFNAMYGTLEPTSSVAFLNFAIDGSAVNDQSKVILWTARGTSNQRWFKRTEAFDLDYTYPGAN